MEVRSRGVARGTDIADDVALVDVLTGVASEGAGVTVNGDVAVAVVDHDVVAVAAAVVACPDHGAAVSSEEGHASW